MNCVPSSIRSTPSRPSTVYPTTIRPVTHATLHRTGLGTACLIGDKYTLHGNSYQAAYNAVICVSYFILSDTEGGLYVIDTSQVQYAQQEHAFLVQLL